MEWTETEIRWFVDDIHVFTISLIKDFLKDDNPFNTPQSFRIKLELEQNPNNVPSNNIGSDSCDILIVDYVMIYEQSDNNSSDEYIPEQNVINSSSICETIMSLERNEINLNTFSLSLIPVILISGLLIILLLIGIIVFLYIRMKNKISKLKKNNKSKDNNYDDIELENIYDNPNDNYNQNYDYPTFEETDMSYIKIYGSNECQTSCDYLPMNKL